MSRQFPKTLHIISAEAFELRFLHGLPGEHHLIEGQAGTDGTQRLQALAADLEPAGGVGHVAAGLLQQQKDLRTGDVLMGRPGSQSSGPASGIRRQKR